MGGKVMARRAGTARAAAARGQRGAAALEFAIVIPVVLLMVFGVIQYGYLYWSLQTASATAREAARRLIVGTDPACVRAEAVGQASLPAVGTTPPSVDWVYHDASGSTSPSATPGGLVTVTVRFQSLDLHLPFLPVPNGGIVSDDGTARVETVPAVPLPC